MTSICSNIAGAVTKWVEKNSPYLINAMANLTCTVVRTGCDWTRKAATAADEVIDIAIARIRRRY